MTVSQMFLTLACRTSISVFGLNLPHVPPVISVEESGNWYSPAPGVIVRSSGRSVFDVVLWLVPVALPLASSPQF